MGGPEGDSGFNAGAMLLKRLKRKYLSDYADNGYMYSYPSNPIELIGYAISPYAKIDGYGNEMLKVMPKEVTNARRALFAKNFGVNADGKDYAGSIVESKYRPSVSSDPNASYYTIPIDDPKTRFEYLSDITGTAKYDFGEDENGKYISVYDVWDLAPFTNRGNDFSGTTPPEIYDRFYQSEIPAIYTTYSFPGVDPSVGPSSGMDFSSGGKIHIKPENRGKFTALKKRTGHSASWFKAHGTPAQKKMAVFALNSRRWGNRKDVGGENLIAEYPEGYNGELRQGKSFNAWDRYLANHPMAGHRLRKAKTLLLDAARVHPLTSFATDVYDSYVGPQDESDKITTPLGVVGRGGDIILNTVKQAGEIEPNMKKVFGRSVFGRLVSLPDFIDDSLKFVRDFAEPVTSFENGGYLLGHVYDLSEEQVNELIRQGYEVERV